MIVLKTQQMFMSKANNVFTEKDYDKVMSDKNIHMTQDQEECVKQNCQNTQK